MSDWLRQFMHQQNVQELAEAALVETLPRCNARVAARLNLMLEGQFVELLPECLTELAKLGQRVPEELLPKLLDHGLKEEQAAEALQPVLGKTGMQLASQNPDWIWGSGNCEDETRWRKGTCEQRIAFLERLRKHDPSRARQLLQERWAKEKWKDRAELLKAFREGASLADEAFLESALDDQNYKVRFEAQHVLNKIPGTAYAQRAQQRLQAWLAFTRKESGEPELKLSLPSECDDSLIRDGFTDHPDGMCALRGIILGDQMSVVPPSFWEHEWQATPAEILEAIQPLFFKNSLLYGLAEAAVLYKDQEWVIFLWPLTRDPVVVWNSFEAFPVVQQEALVHDQIAAGESLYRFRPGPATIANRTRHYSLPFCRTYFDRVCQALARVKSFQAQELRQIFWLMGRSVSPELLPEFCQRLVPEIEKSNKVTAFLRAVYEFYQFRYDMLQELHQ